MTTGYEREVYIAINRISKQLERLANTLEKVLDIVNEERDRYTSDDDWDDGNGGENS